MRDPSVIHVNGTWYLFITDNAAWKGSIPILCSQDATSWKQCGSVFAPMPSWIPAQLPGVANLWAPDISYFECEYHVMLSGGSTVILTGDGTHWMGVGGGTVYKDPASGNTRLCSMPRR